MTVRIRRAVKQNKEWSVHILSLHTLHLTRNIDEFEKRNAPAIDIALRKSSF